MANTTQIELGSVVSLWRYPVKSMMGEELNAAEVTDRGLLGDRAYALRIRPTGKSRVPSILESGRSSLTSRLPSPSPHALVRRFRRFGSLCRTAASLPASKGTSIRS